MTPAAATTADESWLYGLLADAFEPRESLSVSEWADAHRVLSPKASSEPGDWRTSRVPFLREIMDCLSEDSPVQRVVFMKSSQVGGTEAGANWVGYVMDYVRTSKPMLIVVPTEKLLNRWVHQRLHPMIDESEPLKALIDTTKSREGANRIDMKDYPGGIIILTTAGSAPNLKSDSIRFVLCDEADEFGWDNEGRGDPMGMIESRQANFPRRKTFIPSTPTVKDASRIEGEYERSDQRHYEVHCPHCGEYQVMEWEQVQWTRDAAQVWLVCLHNGCVIEERDKPDMLAAGRWVAAFPGRKVRGYHINALYSPIGLGYGWAELVRMWLDAQNDTVKIKQFINERLGRVWEDTKSTVKASVLSERAEDYRLREVPPGCLLLTAGVDTQDNRLALQIVGWGRNKRFWILDWTELPGNPGRDEVWDALADRLNTPLVNAYGKEMRIKATAIDQAGHYTDDVKAFVRRRRDTDGRPFLQHIAMSIVGDNQKQNAVLPTRPRLVDINWRGRFIKNGAEYWRVGTEKAKDRLYNAIKGDQDLPPEKRQAHFSADLEADYYDQLLSEVWDPKHNRYVPKRGHPYREGLDTWAYALAAAHHPMVDVPKKRKLDWDRLAAVLEPAPVGEAPTAGGAPAHRRPERKESDMPGPIPAADPWLG